MQVMLIKDTGPFYWIMYKAKLFSVDRIKNTKEIQNITFLEGNDQ